MHKYFVGIVRDLKKMPAARLYLLPISQVVTTFLENIKDYVGEQTMTEIEETLFQFLGYVNRRHSHLLTDYQALTSRNSSYLEYYIDAFLPPDQVYCEVERPYFLPVFAQKFLRTQLPAEDELKQTLMLDFCKWLFTQQLTDIKLLKDGSTTGAPRE